MGRRPLVPAPLLTDALGCSMTLPQASREQVPWSPMPWFCGAVVTMAGVLAFRSLGFEDRGSGGEKPPISANVHQWGALRQGWFLS